MEHKFFENDALLNGRKVAEGVCPHCGSNSSFDYIDREDEGNSLYYTVECGACHKTFLMHYDLTFTGVTVKVEDNE